MAFEMMDADDGLLPSHGQRIGDAGADQQGASQAGPLGKCDCVDCRRRGLGLSEYFLEQRQYAANMVSRGKFGHDATIFLVHGDLRMQGVREQAARRVIERETCFVTGAFDTENKHGRAVLLRSKRAAQINR